jgi:hypothetical protein
MIEDTKDSLGIFCQKKIDRFNNAINLQGKINENYFPYR